MHSSKHAEDLPAPDTPAAVKDAGSKYVIFCVKISIMNNSIYSQIFFFDKTLSLINYKLLLFPFKNKSADHIVEFSIIKFSIFIIEVEILH